MTRTRKRLLIAAAAILLALAAALALYARSFKPAFSYIPVEQIDAMARRTGMTDCFWIGFAGGGGGANYAYPDTGASYWISQFKLPAGATLSFDGEFPHARHMSFNAYDDLGQPIDRLNDTMLLPEPGSTNPYLPGARRDGLQRHYRMQVGFSDLKAGTPLAVLDQGRPPNTMYMTRSETPAQLILRVYVPDKGLDAKGGVSLPQPRLHMADGTSLQGEALCKAVVMKEHSLRDIHFTLENTRTLMRLSSSTSPYHPAQPVPDWIAFQNPPRTFFSVLKGTSYEWLLSMMSTQRRGGFYSTLDNTYMLTFVDDRLGDTLVVHGKAPTTPRTYDGTLIMPGGQLRYWSLCKYRSIYDTAVDACVHDEQVPVDTEGNYTIVLSKPENRPANATAECGVAWLPWGIGDGMDNPHGGMLVYRHMLPDEKFTQSIFATRAPGDERTALGPYYPDARYTDKAAFERRGCKRAAS